ncbi:MAG TPA: CYTH domain-containing protein [Candidatus Dormibacteraeota bacterium]|nr:CYTH domain-containing protein [Candidatus Dormibacteraeota bacterium]
MSTEREVKLRVPEGFELPAFDGIEVQAINRGSHVLDATYWDTDSLALFNSDHGLRHRTRDGGDGTWTVKGPSTRNGDAVEREEVELPGDAGVLPDALVGQLADIVRGEQLQPVAVIRTVRQVIDLMTADDRHLGELVDDRVVVLDTDGRERSRFRELELEYKGDAGSELNPVLERLQAAGASVDTTAKYARALQALGRLDTPGLRP